MGKCLWQEEKLVNNIHSIEVSSTYTNMQREIMKQREMLQINNIIINVIVLDIVPIIMLRCVM